MNRILQLVGLLKVRIRFMIYWVVDYPIYPGLHFRQYQKIFKSPNEQNGTATFQGKKINYFDGPGFLANIKELFVDNCYYFETTNTVPRIIDCGAYIGLSIIYFKKLFPQAQITAFEADPNIFKVLQQNLLQQELNGVELINKAVWNEETELDFYSENNMSGSAVVNVDQKGKRIKVPTTRLLPFLHLPIDLLKLDIEGAEMAVLQDVQNDLGLVSRIFIEYHSIAKQGQELGELLLILKNAGFRYYIQEANNYAKRPFNGLAKEGYDLQLNIFAMR
jgi:FkbM family methyltransferase